MLEAIGQWSKSRQLWTLAALYIASVALIVRLTSGYGECVIACPRLDKFIFHHVATLIGGILHHDPLSIIVALTIFFGIWELLGKSNPNPASPENQNDGRHAAATPDVNCQQEQNNEQKRFPWRTPISGFFGLGTLEKFTLFLVVIGYFQCWALIATDHTIARQDETARLRDRAFVYFGDPPVTPYPPLPQTAVVWGTGIAIFNSGNMPARRVAIRFSCPDAPRTQDVPDPFALAKWSSAEIASVVGPKNGVNLQGCTIPIETIESAKKRDIKIYLVMEAKYLDGFVDKERVTRMSRSLRFDRWGGRSLGFDGPNNCSDDDCPK